MKIKLLADVHISPITVAQSQEAGYEINRITDYLPANASDIEIIDLALQKEAVIITQDLDFSAIIAKWSSSAQCYFIEWVMQSLR